MRRLLPVGVVRVRRQQQLLLLLHRLVPPLPVLGRPRLPFVEYEESGREFPGRNCSARCKAVATRMEEGATEEPPERDTLANTSAAEGGRNEGGKNRRGRFGHS